MEKLPYSAPRGSRAVQMDAEEASVVITALSLAHSDYGRRVITVQAMRLEGWRGESAILRMQRDLCNSIRDRIQEMAQVELPIDLLRSTRAPLAQPEDCAGSFPRPVRARMLKGVGK